MDHVVRLLPQQTQFQSFSHDLLDTADQYKLTPEQFLKASREKQQLSLMWLVRRLVGRYLFHWPMTKVWLDEMCSAGLAALCDGPLDDQHLMNKLQYAIEVTINNNRSIVRSSLGTNARRSALKGGLEYAGTQSLHNVGEEDSDLLQSSLIDRLSPEDQKTIYENRYDD